MTEYLWDRRGPPDPEIERLEQLLEPLQLKAHCPAAPQRRRIPWAAIAACLVLGVAAWRMQPDGLGQASTWAIADSGRRIYTGESLRAADAAPLTLEAEGFGRIELQPGSDLRVLESTPGRQRMKLEQGRLHALIWAPPGQFVVDTPSARAVDLGCQYDLSVDARGDGFLRVETGWVAFQADDRESFIPSGAACRTTRTRGPGIPYFENASPEFRSAVASFEAGGGSEALSQILAAARPEDALTLWHLLARVDGPARGRVFDRFAQLVPVPAGVTRAQVIAFDQDALDLCWNALGLDDATWWRQWKRSWR